MENTNKINGFNFNQDISKNAIGKNKYHEINETLKRGKEMKSTKNELMEFLENIEITTNYGLSISEYMQVVENL